MDFFNLDVTLNLIERSNKKLIDELDNITFDYNKLTREGDKLLQILNYSPKEKEPDKDKIKNLPYITTPQLSELKNLNFSNLSSISTEEVIPINISYKEKFDMIRSILLSIIDNAIDNNNIYNLKSYEDDDEEFNKLLLKNKKKSEDEEEKMDNEFSIAASRLGLEMNLLNQIKVYLFNNNDYIIINITPKDKIKSIKEKIIKKIIETHKYTLKNTSYKAYEIKIIEKEGDNKFIIDTTSLENDESIFKDKVSTIAFLENPNYISENINEEDELKIEEEEDDKINLKIYYSKNGITNSKLFVVSKEDTLKIVLERFFEQNIFKNKNREQYYFIDHDAIRDIENEINLDTNIKYLPTYELTLCHKDFFDMPEMISEYSNIEIKKNLFNSNNDDILKNHDKYRFNEISAGIYQEFEVYKINKYKIKKRRILGIDMYNLYNNLPKKNNSGIMNIIFKETKNPVRKVENIIECLSIGNFGFYIDIKDEDKNQIKKICYETKSTDIRDEIVDKINFLINYHHNN